MVAAAVGIGTAVAGTAGSVISGNKAAKAQTQAAEQQAQIEREQIAEARRQYDLTRADYAPYRETGYQALDQLGGLYGVGKLAGKIDPTKALEATPGYQFRLNESLKAAQRSAAARGALASGGTMKALARYASGIASDEYNNYANRLAALAGIGQTATNSTADAGQAYVGQLGQANAGISNAIGAAGNARASSYANTGAAIQSGVNNLASLYFSGAFGGNGGGSRINPANVGSLIGSGSIDSMISSNPGVF